MWKKLLLLFTAMWLFWAAGINICWELSVNRHSVPGFYSQRQIRDALAASRMAAEELLPGDAVLPELSRSCRLRLRPADGDVRLLSHRLLMETEGIISADAVFANGIALGTVKDGRLLFSRLRRYIKNQMPNAAVMGRISGDLRVKSVYSLPGHETGYEDMLLLITGIAPVFYLDSEGRQA